MIPGARQALRKIFRDADVITYISDYTLGRLRPFMPADQQLLRLPSGIDTHRFHPNPAARALLRDRYRLGEAPTVVCVSRLVARKGQDSLIKVWPRVAEQVPGARLVIVDGAPTPSVWPTSNATRLLASPSSSPARSPTRNCPGT